MSSSDPLFGSDAHLAQVKGHQTPAALCRRLVLIGTSQTLRSLIRLVHDEPHLRAPVGCFLVDAHEAEAGDFISGTQVLGGMNELVMLHQMQPFTMALVSIPASRRSTHQRVVSQLNELGITSREVAPLADVIAAPASPVAPANAGVNLVELIGRTPYGIDRRAVSRVIEHKRVLVTGAGGSIGSEICRIVATFAPEELILVERSENALFEIDRQIARRFPGVKRRAVLHDVVDAPGTLALMRRTQPHAVFHAAAHKHVPLMEDHPGAAVTNNLLGTKSVADAAVAAGCDRFVMISSDKAVNPTSIMGATKRLAEMYVQGLGARPETGTSMSMVRFGNVLGSACSVLPIWGAQLAEGGPVTVTDDRMTRYFMTINEAAALVIQASTIECRGGSTPSIYVLDMGEPVRILDLAERFVRLSGYDPIRSGLERLSAGSTPAMEIRLTGIRKGEKLHEELSYEAEALSPTAYPGINAFTASKTITWDTESMVTQLAAAAATATPQQVAALIRLHVPEMRTPAGAEIPADSGEDSLTDSLQIKPNTGSVRTSAAA
jgi:FlaA1/EpsC-like NDP-sugar epimerase